MFSSRHGGDSLFDRHLPHFSPALYTGFVSALNVIPFVDPKVGVIVFAAASILKDAVNRLLGELFAELFDGQAEQFRGFLQRVFWF